MSGAISGVQHLQTFAAAANLSAYQYHFVYLTDDLTVNVAGANAITIGILQNKDCDAAGKACKVAILGSVSKLVAGEGAAVGKMITAKSDGHGEIADAADEFVGAIALTAAGAANDEFTVLVTAFDAVSSDA